MKIIKRIRKLLEYHPRIQWKFIAVGLFALIMLVQFLYPSGRIPPRSYLGNIPVGIKSRDTIKQDLENNKKAITIEFNGKPVEFDPTVAGLDIDVGKTMEELPSFKWYERAIPLWPFLKAIPKKTSRTIITRDSEKIEKFAETLSNSQHSEPVSASAEMKDGKLVIKEAVEGEEYPAGLIKQTLQSKDPFSNPPANLKPKIKPAAIYAKDLEGLKNQLALITAQPLKVSYGNTVKETDTKTLATLVKVVPVPDSNIPQLGLNPEVLDPKIQEWNKEFTVAPGITQISQVDNTEVSRKTGASGRTLDVEKVKNQITEWIKKPSAGTVVLASQTLAPKVVVTRTFSQSSAGLLAKLKFWIETHPGKYQVAIRELGGQGREASYNVSQQTVMASTYKTFLAFVAYKQSESGALNLSSGLINGKNIEQCIEVMIVNSNNDCAVALGKHIGWSKVDEIIASQGFSGVRLNNYDSSGNINGDKLVNAREQANFLAQLSGNLLINSSNTSKLLSYMKRQTYREGIPAGSRGSVVADKVGFLEGYLHDVGIVYSPKATYALVIMSTGSSWSNISSLASAVYDFMNE